MFLLALDMPDTETNLHSFGVMITVKIDKENGTFVFACSKTFHFHLI